MHVRRREGYIPKGRYGELPLVGGIAGDGAAPGITEARVQAVVRKGLALDAEPTGPKPQWA